MEVKNNPAGRLSDILHLALTYPQDKTLKVVWAGIFNINPDQTGLVLQMFAETISLVTETKKSIERIDDVDHELFLEPFKQIDLLFSRINMDAPWKNYLQYLDDKTLYGLRHASDKLSRVSGYKIIPENEIESIYSEIDQLLVEVIRSDFPEELKALFQKNLESLMHALLVYRIHGIDGLTNELDRAIGSLIRNNQKKYSGYDKSPHQDHFKKLWEILININTLVTMAQGVYDLTGPAMEAIGGFLR